MTSTIRAAARELPIVVAGAGPAGVSTGIGLRQAGVAVQVFEARDPAATRARNIFLRPQAREILRQFGFADPKAFTSIMALENGLRHIAREAGVPVFYRHRVLDVVDRQDHVLVTVQGPDGTVQTLRGRAFVDASGGRIASMQEGVLERPATSGHHVYVTAQYDTQPRFPRVFGAFDRQRNEAMYMFPVDTGFVSYLDLPPGRPMGDEGVLLARYDALAGRLQLGTPMSAPQAFDAQQHLSRSAASGRLLKIGDSAGNADPYIGAGTAAALVDARNAVRLLSSDGDVEMRLGQASDEVLAGHRHLGNQAAFMLRFRPLAMRSFPSAHFDERLSSRDLDTSRFMEVTSKILTSLPIRT